MSALPPDNLDHDDDRSDWYASPADERAAAAWDSDGPDGEGAVMEDIACGLRDERGRWIG